MRLSTLCSLHRDTEQKHSLVLGDQNALDVRKPQFKSEEKNSCPLDSGGHRSEAGQKHATDD